MTEQELLWCAPIQDEYIHDMQSLCTEFRNFIDVVASGKIPDIFPDISIPTWYLNLDIIREWYIRNIGYSILTNKWLDPFIKWLGASRCLEIMSGSGALAKVLQDRGIPVIATDNMSWEFHGGNFKTEIENIDCLDAINKYGMDVDYIICSWPYMDSTMTRALFEMRKVNPRCRLIYIGAGRGGCTASNSFFKYLKKDPNLEFYLINRHFPSWPGCHDSLWLVK